jgi:hypothetical protein
MVQAFASVPINTWVEPKAAECGRMTSASPFPAFGPPSLSAAQSSKATTIRHLTRVAPGNRHASHLIVAFERTLIARVLPRPSSRCHEQDSPLPAPG